MNVLRIEADLLDSNVFVATENDVCVIVDAGASLEKIKQVVGEKKVVGVLLTHAHYDHCYYAQDYAKEFSCKIYCSKNAREYLENSVYNYSEGHFKVEGFSEFIFLDCEGKLSFDGIKVSYTQLGGHSLADMIFKIENDVFVGDLLIGRDIGRLDLYGGSKEGMKSSLDYLIKLDFETIHSGHGEDNSKDSQIKVMKLWQKFLNR